MSINNTYLFWYIIFGIDSFSFNWVELIITGSGDHFQSIFLLGTLSAQIKNFKTAINLLKKAIQINPDYLDAYNNLGNVYREMGSPCWDA